ncbi:MAG: hypothetical protein ABL964_16205 [Steroidobacteraceae bacterium]
MLKQSVLALALAVVAGGCAREAEAPAAAAAVVSDVSPQEEANKKVAMEFFREGITADERYALMHPDYIQHNPTFKKFGELNGSKGREEFVALQKMRERGGMPAPAAADPNRPKNEPLYQVMVDGDLVTVLQRRYAPDPLKPGEYYETFWFDTWRIKEGKLYEHWDANTIDPNNIPVFLKTRVEDMK